MNYHYRQCAGVKVEFITEEMKIPHTEADPIGHEWAKLSAIQEQAEVISYTAAVETMYDKYKNWKCDKYIITGGKCSGQTVIRSLNPASASTIYSCLFIGCEKWKPWSKGHIFVSLTVYDCSVTAVTIAMVIKRTS